MTLDAPTTALLKDLSTVATKPLSDMTPAEARDMASAVSSRYGSGPQVARTEEHLVPVSDGATVPVRLFVPAGTPRAVILHFHGGGWVTGAADEFEAFARVLAVRSGCAVALADYRLAPEHRFPTAVHDAFAVTQWLADQRSDLFGEQLPLIVSGDSAGGNLAAIVSRRARDESGPAIEMQILAYPVTDCDLDRPSYLEPSNQLMLTKEGMAWFWDHYLPDVAARESQDASPLRAADLSGLPAMVIVSAEHDPLLDEGVAYASALEAAGVSVVQKTFTGQMHGFLVMADALPQSAVAVDFIVEQLEHHLRLA